MSEHIRLRLDKWLWAARFFKTRALAKKAIEAGRVLFDGERDKPKVAKEVELGNRLRIRQGDAEKVVIVRGIDPVRRGAPAAQLLYEETAASQEAREQAAEARSLARRGMRAPSVRPDKHDRVALVRLKRDA